ncbi:MAG: DUF1579 family protein [Planctomycetota bacterium]|nr:DUF1579 family protein [Planctomycetota bacterium]
MNGRTLTAVVMVSCGLAGLALQGCASGSKKAKAPMSEEAMMAAMMQAATPGPMHERLASTQGTWEGTMTWWMAPDAPPSTSKTKTVITPIMGGRYTQADTSSMMDMGGGQTMPFTGMGLYGYNNTDKQFESIWIDSMGTSMIKFTGEMKPDGSIVWFGKFTDPTTGNETWMREVERMEGPNTMVLEFWGPRPDGKGEYRSGEIRSTRR